MTENINEILETGKSQKAGNEEIQEMLALFHKTEYEYSLKELLFSELEQGEIKEFKFVDYNQMFKNVWTKIEENTKERSGKTRKLSGLIKIAAAVIIGLFLGSYLTSVIQIEEPVYYTSRSPKGSISEILLPDGSFIYLNAGSNIKYNVNGENGDREVFLNGEAWFDVAKNPEKEFVVHTPFYNVNVTGTKFNVKAYGGDDEVITTLEEGEVIISSSKENGLKDEITLSPGEQVSFNKSDKSINVESVNPEWFTSWKDNKLILVNMSLKEFLVVLERKYGVEIRVPDSEIQKLHVDCTIKNESIIEILDILKRILPIDYDIVGQEIIIKSDREKK